MGMDLWSDPSFMCELKGVRGRSREKVFSQKGAISSEKSVKRWTGISKVTNSAAV